MVNRKSGTITHAELIIINVVMRLKVDVRQVEGEMVSCSCVRVLGNIRKGVE